MYKCKKKDCFYKMGSDSGGTGTHCAYILITGVPRECPADKCDKYISEAYAKARGMKKATMWEGEIDFEIISKAAKRKARAGQKGRSGVPCNSLVRA